MPDSQRPAPGGPGLDPRWTSSAKSGVGTAFDGRSLVWFTISHGIVDEVYYPGVDRANTRDFQLLIAGADGFFAEEKRDTGSVVHLLAPAVPGYRLVNRCYRGKFEIEKTVISDPERDVLLTHVRFRPLVGTVADFRLFALIAPHIGNEGFGNDAWVGDYKGTSMLFAQREAASMALACDTGWEATSCAYVGQNDGWRQVRDHGRLVELYTEARDGNVAMCGQVDLSRARVDADGVAEFTLALGFGLTPAQAAQQTRMTMASTFQRIEESFTRSWHAFHGEIPGRVPGTTTSMPEDARREAARDLASHASESTQSHRGHRAVDRRRKPSIELPPSVLDLYRMSAAVLAVHEDKRASGALIASLSIPWGASKSDQELGGYHLVWPRDLVQSATALLAIGHRVHARRTMRYLISIQEAAGDWAQNVWLDGTAYWNGVQLDETAFPILLAGLLHREGELKDIDPWPSVRRAAAFLARVGPVTGQDRWEENSGYSPFTMAVGTAALLVAADFAERAGEHDFALSLRHTADAWNAAIDERTYVTGTELARRVGVDGYYVRIAPAEGGRNIPIKNRPAGADVAVFDSIVSPDALALVRFGLRAADDQRILNTVRVIDAVVRRDMKTGPGWHRYNEDGYGEKEDGSAFDGTGIGRPWPLLAGERAHYELAAGRADVALQLLGVMRAQASDGGMLPEQVWDRDDIPERELYNGRSTGSAMPLVWAHAEYVKLVRSLRDGRIFDMPRQTYDRYVRARRSTSE